MKKPPEYFRNNRKTHKGIMWRIIIRAARIGYHGSAVLLAVFATIIQFIARALAGVVITHSAEDWNESNTDSMGRRVDSMGNRRLYKDGY